MKILMLLDNEPSKDIRVLNEAISLNKVGHEIYILCIRGRKKERSEVYNGIIFINSYIPEVVNRKLKGLISFINLHSIVWAINAYLVIREKHIYIIHMHDLFMFGCGILLKRFDKTVKLVGDLHENYADAISSYSFIKKTPQKYFISIKRWKEIEARWINKVDYKIVVIEEMRDRVGKFSPGNIFVVQNYLKTENFFLSGTKGSFVNLLYIGGLDKHRGVETLIFAIKKLEKVLRVKCKIVGSGIMLDYLRRLTKELVLNDQIDFIGWLSYDKLPGEIVSSEICIVPHIKNNHTDNTIPHKIFQYMYFEKPVIVTNCNPLKRIVEKYKCGLVYESGNHEALSDCIMLLLENEKLREEMGRRGKLAITEDLNWNIAEQNLHKLYNQMTYTHK